MGTVLGWIHDWKLADAVSAVTACSFSDGSRNAASAARGRKGGSFVGTGTSRG